MHNHMRMYVASLCCNIAQSHWLLPAKWLYANLLDGDLASNHLSWQWVAGTFSNKKYYANQDNINKYFYTQQKDTFLDVNYSDFNTIKIPQDLSETATLNLTTSLPDFKNPSLKKDKATLIYNYYNLDPTWYQNKNLQRVLLLEPSIFKKNQVTNKCIDFAINLSRNIPNIQIFIGEFEELLNYVNSENIIFKEHPLNNHYVGKQESREWLSSITGYFPSFFSFWKKCKKELQF